MAYWIVKTNNYNNSKYYQCDFLSDIYDLPTYLQEGKKQNNDTISSYKCAPGSKCLCQEDGSIWFLGKDTASWIKYIGSSSSNISFLNEEPSTLSEEMIWIEG